MKIVKMLELTYFTETPFSMCLLFGRKAMTGIGKFSSDDHYIYYCGKESLRRNGVAITVKKEPEMQYLDAVSKKTE